MPLSSMSSDSLHVLWNDGSSSSEYFLSNLCQFDRHSTSTPEENVAIIHGLTQELLSYSLLRERFEVCVQEVMRQVNLQSYG